MDRPGGTTAHRRDPERLDVQRRRSGAGHLVLVGTRVAAAATRVLPWWTPALVVVTAGAPGALVAARVLTPVMTGSLVTGLLPWAGLALAIVH